VLVERAIQLGVNMFDTAAYYQGTSPRSSEELLGDILPEYRSDVYICTKICVPDVDTALQQF